VEGEREHVGSEMLRPGNTAAPCGIRPLGGHECDLRLAAIVLADRQDGVEATGPAAHDHMPLGHYRTSAMAACRSRCRGERSPRSRRSSPTSPPRHIRWPSSAYHGAGRVPPQRLHLNAFRVSDCRTSSVRTGDRAQLATDALIVLDNLRSDGRDRDRLHRTGGHAPAFRALRARKRRVTRVPLERRYPDDRARGWKAPSGHTSRPAHTHAPGASLGVTRKTFMDGPHASRNRCRVVARRHATAGLS